MNPVKMKLEFMVKLYWKAEDIIIALKKIYRDNSPKNSNLQMGNSFQVSNKDKAELRMAYKSADHDVRSCEKK